MSGFFNRRTPKKKWAGFKKSPRFQTQGLVRCGSLAKRVRQDIDPQREACPFFYRGIVTDKTGYLCHQLRTSSLVKLPEFDSI